MLARKGVSHRVVNITMHTTVPSPYIDEGDGIESVLDGLGFNGQFTEIFLELKSRIIPSRHVWILIIGDLVFEFRIPSAQAECVRRSVTNKVELLTRIYGQGRFWSRTLPCVPERDICCVESVLSLGTSDSRKCMQAT